MGLQLVPVGDRIFQGEIMTAFWIRVRYNGDDNVERIKLRGESSLGWSTKAEAEQDCPDGLVVVPSKTLKTQKNGPSGAVPDALSFEALGLI